MEKTGDIYIRTGRRRKRYEFLLLENQRARLERLAKDQGRSLPDLITEGISIVLVAYEDLHPEWEGKEEPTE
ncbi:unnamed protein product [marine sediment metagenome]|uniref:Ribbon-helix-helix protein CopG domain-containing protein n=1 Tax=marine sediment metagenome TaxID=412755 RepID=X1RB76_9ZZZZ